MLDLVLLLIAVICFAAAAVNVKVGSLNLVAAGLFFFAVRGLLG